MRCITRVVAALAILAVVALPMRAQSQATTPAFEVATIKPLGENINLGGRTVARANLFFQHPPAEPLHGISGNRFSIEITDLTDLMVDAYNVRRDQISGAPRWGTPDGDLYEVTAKAESGGTLTSDQARLMLQKMLADRFHLTLHRETKTLPVYELTIGKNGPKIKEVPAGTPLPKNAAAKGLLLGIISNYLDYPLVDKTGLTGANYQFDMDFTELLEEVRRGKPAPSIFGAVQDQLGLKLEKTNAPTEILVIDHAEKPSEN
jgi:bla regulator protein BlaR1